MHLLDLENPPPSESAQLLRLTAIEYMGHVHEVKGKEGISQALKVRHVAHV